MSQYEVAFITTCSTYYTVEAASEEEAIVEAQRRDEISDMPDDYDETVLDPIATLQD